MEKSALNRIKRCCAMKCYGDYVAVSGSHLWLLRSDGSLIFMRKDIRHVEKVHFLDQNRLLVAKKTGYHLISLINGADLWESPRPKGIAYGPCDFAVSADCVRAYDFCKKTSGERMLISIDVISGEIDWESLNGGYCGICDFRCDTNNTPCLLTTQLETVSGEKRYECGVLQLIKDSPLPINTTTWKYKWYFTFPRDAWRFLDNTNYVLTRDLAVFSPATGELIPIVEAPGKFSSLLFNASDLFGVKLSETHYILWYLTYQIVVERNTRKIVGVYNAKHASGCIVGDEYWLSFETGIERRPFPSIETVREEKFKAPFIL